MDNFMMDDLPSPETPSEGQAQPEPQPATEATPQQPLEHPAEPEKKEVKETAPKTATRPEKPSQHLSAAIIGTIFCIPVGIVAIVYSLKVHSAYDKGQYEEAKASSLKAKQWAIGGVMAGILDLMLLFALIG